MTTLVEAKHHVRSLSQKALDTVENATLSNAAKKSILDGIEPELKHWTGEVRSLEGFEVTRKSVLARFGNDPASLYTGEANGGTGVSATGFATKAAPPVRISDDTAAEMYEAARSRKSFAVDIGLKLSDSSGTPPIPDYDRLPTLVRREPNRILDLIPSRAVASPIVEYFVQSSRATAGVVAEGAIKPGSDVSLPMQQARAAKIAGWVDVTDETLADFDQFLSIVTADLSAAVVDAENREMLNGSGVGPNFITGMLATTGILTRAFNSAAGGDTYALDTLDLAEADLRNGPAFAEVTAWVMHPTTFSRTRRAKDAQNRFILSADPTAETAQTIWGKPVVLTTQIATGVALGAEFSDAARGFVREGVRITMSNSTIAADGTSNFKRNVTTVLAEERIGMYVPRPASMIKVSGLPS